MKTRTLLLSILVLLTVIAVPVLSPAAGIRTAHGQTGSTAYRLVGYYPSYAVYDGYSVNDINAEDLTALNYGWGTISVNGQCESSDTWTDTQYSYPDDTPDLRLRGNIRQLQLLRGEHPNLKLLFTVGGWDYSERFSDVARTPESRERFARSCVAFIRQYLFDGIDIDWRYPVSGGQFTGRPEDTGNFTLLLAELRAQLDEAGARDGKQYLLTILAPAIESLWENMELDQIHPYLDWINLMAFGFHGDWSTLASHHAPLYSNTRDPRGPDVQNGYNVDAAVSHYLDVGVPADKIVVGIPFYGQTWRNVQQGDYLGLYEPADGVPSGTRPGGILYYRDLLPLLNDPDFVKFFDEEVSAPWMYNPQERIAISYEDAQSIRAKATYVRQRQLGGVMVWQLNFDDATNSLLNLTYAALSKQ